jgi:hypothetical protein
VRSGEDAARILVKFPGENFKLNPPGELTIPQTDTGEHLCPATAPEPEPNPHLGLAGLYFLRKKANNGGFVLHDF